jgi:hypothetical protein
LKIVGEENIDAEDIVYKKVAEKALIMNFVKIDPN